MNLVYLTSIIVKENRVEINYQVKGKIKKYFRENTFWMEFQENIENVPNGILVIPFLGDILPLIWVTDSKLVIDEIDKTFYESLGDIKKGYEDMYPELNFLGEVEVGKIIDYSYEPIQKSCQFFSGGADSVATFVNRKNENPDLITIWGADVEISRNAQWGVVKKFVREYGEKYNLKNVFIKSNFRKIYSTHKLNKVYGERMHGNWWFNMQHGLGIITHGIIHAYIHKIQTIYIPSSFTAKSKNVKCASYPTIDEAVKFCGKGHIIHEGFQYSRQDKVSLIVDYVKKTKKKLKLRVCWEGDNGDNCNHCEKCLRTIVNLILEGEDPRDYGFNIEKKDLKDIVAKGNINFNKSSWTRMKKAYEQDEFWKDDEDMKWLKDIKITLENIGGNLGEIIVGDIVVNGNRVEINYKVNGEIKKYFRENTFWMEFQENIENVPKGVLIISFLGDILPLIWITDSKLVIDEIDKTFYESLGDIKKGYEDMYPELNFLGEVEVGKIIDYSYEPMQRSCQFFSGGIDSTATLINRKKEHPDLITLWGADISIDNERAWKVFKKYIESCGELHNLKNIFIKSNYRKIYSTHKLNKVYEEISKRNWWLGFQHGLALNCIGIVYAYIHKIETIYIPGSYDVTSKDIRCSTYPTIDEKIKFCGKGHIIHEGFQYSREDKVDIIVDYVNRTKEQIKLKLCWEGDEGDNCNHCHKCLKGIVTLILAGEDPNDYGFSIEKKDIEKRIVNSKIVLSPGWDKLKEKYKQNIEKWKDDKDMEWLGNLDIEGQNKRNLQKRKNFFIKTYRKIENKFKKI